MAEYVQALTTVASAEEAAELARGVTGARHAACVQIVGPIRSVYWWQGKLEEAQEWQLLIKTTSAAFPALEAFVKANHPYDTPELIACPIVAGSREYLDWITAETGAA